MKLFSDHEIHGIFCIKATKHTGCHNNKYKIRALIDVPSTHTSVLLSVLNNKITLFL
jgi:hypothetical protein